MLVRIVRKTPRSFQRFFNCSASPWDALKSQYLSRLSCGTGDGQVRGNLGFRTAIIENQRTRFVHTRALERSRAVTNQVSLAQWGASMSWKSKRFQHVKNTLTCKPFVNKSAHTKKKQDVPTLTLTQHRKVIVKSEYFGYLEHMTTHLPTDTTRQILNN